MNKAAAVSGFVVAGMFAGAASRLPSLSEYCMINVPPTSAPALACMVKFWTAGWAKTPTP